MTAWGYGVGPALKLNRPGVVRQFRLRREVSVPSAVVVHLCLGSSAAGKSHLTMVGVRGLRVC